MTYTVDYRPEALKTLHKLDPSVSEMILEWIDKNLVGVIIRASTERR